MKKTLRLAALFTLNFVLWMFFFAVFVRADNLGYISSDTTQACSAGGVTGGVCHKLIIAGCANTANFQVLAKVNQVTSPVGMVTFTEGGGGNGGYYDTHFTYGTLVVQGALNNNLNTVQLNYNGGSVGWLTGAPTYPGDRALACRNATVREWAYTNVANSQSPFCATGTSGGAGGIAYDLAEYSAGTAYTYVQLVSGPPFSREDEGCGDVNAPSVVTACGKVLSPVLTAGQATLYINPGDNGHCYPPNQNYATALLDQSILAPDAVTVFPATEVEQLIGSNDSSPAAAQAAMWQSAVPQTITACVQGATHEMASTLVGANAILNHLIAGCK